jgi:ribokinase
MHNSPDFVAIGDITTDAFIRLDDAEVKECVDHHRQELCLSFGDKVPYEFVKIVRGVGNSANAAVAAARLGLRSSLMANVGGDVNGKECLQALSDNKVSVGLMSVHKKLETNYHYVLWYDVERTILVKHQHYPYSLPTMKTPPAWMYLSSLGENSLEFHMEILSYLSKHRETKLVFQPGTYQMKFGVRQLKGLYEQTEVFFCNVEEAQRILKTEEADIKKLLKGMSDLGPRFVFITDGIKGAYAYDRKDMWFMPVYPQEPYERTGAGDAFSSTVTVALAKGKSIEEALMWGPINSASVVQYIGAQEGLLTEEKLLQFLEKAPANYKPVKI